VQVTAQFNISDGKEVETLPAILFKGTADEVDRLLSVHLKEAVRKIINATVDMEAFTAAVEEKVAKKGKKGAEPAKATPTLDMAPTVAPFVKPEPKEVIQSVPAPSKVAEAELILASEEVDEFDESDTQEGDDSFEEPELVAPGDEPSLAANNIPGGRPIETAGPVTAAATFADDDDF
jgi:hypothetical protein